MQLDRPLAQYKSAIVLAVSLFLEDSAIGMQDTRGSSPELVEPLRAHIPAIQYNLITGYWIRPFSIIHHAIVSIAGKLLLRLEVIDEENSLVSRKHQVLLLSLPVFVTVPICLSDALALLDL